MPIRRVVTVSRDRSRRRLTAIAVGLVALLCARPAAAQQADVPQVEPFVPTFAGLHFDTSDQTEEALSTTALTFTPSPAAEPQTSAPAPVAFEYSHGYEVRNRIHRIASFATLPLFGVAVYTGQKLYNDPTPQTSNVRHLHGTIAIAITGLFGLNSVTGIWNMMEARKDPHGHTRRTIHGILMLIGEGGFMATALDHPGGRTVPGSTTFDTKRSQHIALAYSSLGVATVSYLMMLFR